MFKRILLLAAVFLAVAAAPVAAQDDGYGPDESFVVDDTTVRPGDVVGVSGTGCPPGSTVTFTIDGEVVGTATADDDGAFDGDVTIPDLAPGTYQLVATCGDLVQSVTIEVLGAGAADGDDDDGDAGVTPGDDQGPGGDLARTGSDYVGILVPLGAGLLTLGGLILLSTRKRRPGTASAA